jgi:hypothetical protein
MADSSMEVWDLWFPEAGASGLSFARCRVNSQEAGDRILVHAAPRKLNVTVRDMDGRVKAQGQGLRRGQTGPMSYLVREGESVVLEDGWPSQADIGRVVLLPGGEAAILKSWWHAEDRSEWRWTVEFYNHR